MSWLTVLNKSSAWDTHPSPHIQSNPRRKIKKENDSETSTCDRVPPMGGFSFSMNSADSFLVQHSFASINFVGMIYDKIFKFFFSN